MRCPKCKTPMHGVKGASILSGLEKSSGRIAECIEGSSCYNCGTWVEPEFVPVIARKGAHFPKHKTGTAKPKVRALEVIAEIDMHWKDIKKLRAEKVPIRQIIRTLGLTTAASTLQSHAKRREQQTEAGVVPPKKDYKKHLTRHEVYATSSQKLNLKGEKQ